MARQTVFMAYVRAELKYGLSVEKGTDRVPDDGQYHFLVDGEVERRGGRVDEGEESVKDARRGLPAIGEEGDRRIHRLRH